jgi:hypothetical protein
MNKINKHTNTSQNNNENIMDKEVTNSKFRNHAKIKTSLSIFQFTEQKELRGQVDENRVAVEIMQMWTFTSTNSFLLRVVPILQSCGMYL